MTELIGAPAPTRMAAFARGCLLASARRRTQDAWLLQSYGPTAAGERRGAVIPQMGRLGGTPVQQPDRGAERGHHEQHEQAGLDELEGPEPVGRLVQVGIA